MTSRPLSPDAPEARDAPDAPEAREVPEAGAPESPAVAVSLNGESRQVPDGLPLDRLVATLTTAPSGVAVAVNEAVVPRGQWPGVRLAEGDRIEVLTAVQGG